MSGNAFMPKRTFQPEPGVMDLLKDWPNPQGQDEDSNQITAGASQPGAETMHETVRTNAFFKPKSMTGIPALNSYPYEFHVLLPLS